MRLHKTIMRIYGALAEGLNAAVFKTAGGAGTTARPFESDTRRLSLSFHGAMIVPLVRFLATYLLIMMQLFVDYA